MSDTPTPETEKWQGRGVGGLEVVPAFFARELERKLNETRRGWREMQSRLERSMDEFEKLIRELDETREQRDRLAEAFEKVSTFGTVLKLPVKPCDLCARTLKQPTKITDALEDTDESNNLV